MFGKISLKKADKALKRVFKKVKLNGEFEIKDGSASATAYDVIARGENVDMIMVDVYPNGCIFISAMLGHLEPTMQNLMALQKYNQKSLGWRAYIDEHGDLDFDLDCFCVNPKAVRKFVYQNLNGFLDEEELFHTLCKSCTQQ